MKIEDKVGNKNGPCWASFIRRCMENETLIIPHNVWSDGQDRQHKINKLTELVFNSEGLKNMDNFFLNLVLSRLKNRFH